MTAEPTQHASAAWKAIRAALEGHWSYGYKTDDDGEWVAYCTAQGCEWTSSESPYEGRDLLNAHRDHLADVLVGLGEERVEWGVQFSDGELNFFDDSRVNAVSWNALFGGEGELLMRRTTVLTNVGPWEPATGPQSAGQGAGGVETPGDGAEGVRGAGA